jgi:hypothetical protein
MKYANFRIKNKQLFHFFMLILLDGVAPSEGETVGEKLRRGERWRRSLDLFIGKPAPSAFVLFNRQLVACGYLAQGVGAERRFPFPPARRNNEALAPFGLQLFNAGLASSRGAPYI